MLKSSQHWQIYDLSDPRTLMVRYVGVTHVPIDRRMREHRNNKTVTHCRCWIRSLLKLSLRPICVVVESGVGDGWQDRERNWILRMRGFGFPLTNLTDGGDGSLGHKHTDEAKAKVAAAMRGNTHGLGYRHSVEARAKMSKALIGNTHAVGCTPSIETRAKLSAASTGNVNALGHRHSSETKAKISLAGAGNTYRLGFVTSPETKAKLSKSVKSFFARKRAEEEK